MESTIIYSVYARPNENNKVTRFFSSCFEEPLKTDVLVKSGYGDEFIHVEYFEVLTTEGAHTYKIENNKLELCTDEEIANELAMLKEIYAYDLNELESISGGKLSTAGWYRIAKYPGGEGSKYANSCEISIKRTFENVENEYHNLRLVSVSSLYEFQPITSKSANQLIDNIRYTYDENNGYIEVYYNGDVEEAVHISIIKAKDYNYKWTATIPELTEDAAEGVTVVCEYNIPNTAAPADIRTMVDVSVPVESWVEDATYTDFPYKADIAFSGITDDYIPDVAYDVYEALSGVYAPVSSTGDGVVTIYANTIPTDAIVIPSIKCVKVV